MNRNTENFSLPAGWKSDVYGGRVDIIVLTRHGDGGGFVTLDFKKRIYAGGMGLPYRHEGVKKSYLGRGWRQELVDDAVAWLNNVMS